MLLAFGFRWAAFQFHGDIIIALKYFVDTETCSKVNETKDMKEKKIPSLLSSLNWMGVFEWTENHDYVIYERLLISVCVSYIPAFAHTSRTRTQ